MKSIINRKSNTATIRESMAIFLIIAVMMFLVLSLHLIAHEAYHECGGDDCPICALIQISSNGLRELSSGAPVTAAIAEIVFFSLMMQTCASESSAISTPVSRKTRLNN